MSNGRPRTYRNNGRSNQRRNGGGSDDRRNSPRRRNDNRGISASGALSAFNDYSNKAKEALRSGDRISAENFFQHADHYNRIVISANERKEQIAAEQKATEAPTSNNVSADEPTSEAVAEKTDDESGDKRA